MQVRVLSPVPEIDSAAAPRSTLYKYCRGRGPVPQLAEGIGLNPTKCWFESSQGYQRKRRHWCVKPF